MTKQAVETAPEGTSSATATTANPTPDPVQAAAEQTRREVQAQKDREIAGLHKEYQAKIAKLTGKAKEKLREKGVDNPDAIERELADEAEFDEFRAWKQQREAERVASQMAHEIASLYGLRGDDPRLLGAATWDEFRGKAKAAAAEDVRHDLEAAEQRQATQRRDELTRHVQSGALNTLGGAPAGGGGDLRQQYEAEKARVRRGDVKALVNLQTKYRKLGLSV